MENLMLKAALKYLEMGWPVFPVSWDEKHEKRKSPLIEWKKKELYRKWDDV